MALGIGSGRYAPAPTRRESDVDHLIATLFQDAREGVLVVDAERRVVDLSDDEKRIILERLKLAREMVGGTDALEWLRSWKAPEER